MYLSNIELPVLSIYYQVQGVLDLVNFESNRSDRLQLPVEDEVKRGEH